MSLTTRASTVRKGAILGGAALAVGLFGSSGAWAQCTDTFNFRAANVPSPGQFAPVSVLAPLGTGSSLSAFISTINSVNTAFLTNTSAFVSAPGNPQPDQQGSGVWGRVIAGTVDTKTTSAGTLDLSGLAVPQAATGTQTCHTTTRQDYAGYQVGHDISILNGAGSGANWHWGVTAGYFEAKTKDITGAGTYINPNFPADPFNTPAGTFSANTQVPFVGIYTAFTKGNFFLDGQARWDFYQNRLSDSANGLFSQELDARGFSLTGNVGYNIPLGSGWFIEPSGGLVWSRVHVDPLNVAGVLQTAAPFAPYARGTVTIEDIDSLLGRASLTVGTNFTSGGVAWQPFFTASVINEFAGDVTARSVIANTGNPGLDGLQLTTSTSRVGTYGQFALGTAAAIVNTGWVGYARVDYRIGEDIEGWSVNAGLRYQFTPEQRRGSIKDGPVPAVYSYNWTGPYIGVSAGATVWGHEDWIYQISRNKVDGLGFAGYLAGGQAGYNVQVGKYVFGIEGDYGWSNAHGGKSCPNAFFFTCVVEADQLGSLTGRLGYTWGRALFYAKGGWAVGDVTLKTVQNQALPTAPSNTPVNGETKTLSGWTLGGGMEFALTDRVSAKAEYMYYDLGSATYAVDNGLRVDSDTRGSTVRIGVNLHFNPIRREEAPLK
jgi:opacity protein-like surface antigen